jgi:hypothetical protein
MVPAPNILDSFLLSILISFTIPDEIWGHIRIGGREEGGRGGGEYFMNSLSNPMRRPNSGEREVLPGE